MSAEPNNSAIFDENQESFPNSPESLTTESEASVTDEAKTVTNQAASSEEFSLLGGMNIDALQEEIDNLKQDLEEQTQQVDAYKKRYITLAADFDNFRKRTAKEKEELETKIKGKTLMEILGVVDNFERARTQIKPANDGEMGIHKSYQGVYKTLVESLKRLGVSPMRPEGQPFDPTYHEAMMREYTDEHPEGTVVEQLVRGYTLGEDVLRHALVKVAAPKAADPNADQSESTSIPSQESA
ncbi:MAG: nucleotide exchange factor GrpE [Microcystis aeruginosa Ma_QC_Ch_20071001_S25]|jgi:molecular chaperone GrpE|uniref:Protein GrpE n=1 Tax=Microcystis aeruginosa Ma_QC_Ch_20071001_S25D TaxID=2486250 RepID=A0A552FTN6_MICAE|nr:MULTISPECIES: nucleotide exchange factor GrpE [unclassified Microcystis]MCA2763058.1 nucleotide exchange factor GrpE [Microcystis sp. M151S2]TRU50094.1 MAG: nucleotide exchange factor GrpE [Microcystis aeruginosa Ma_QC_Ch_20071001_S25D]TRU53123.1 MAG: nucleotide exchange factor GrpE [Microcystis aeruginosa Ma_QC_Ch_20071001_S25]TRU58052.1 MAG: nucleotide exchange factor GrpE [Microcystis aeruginosa Ma_QC_Ch_20071001_M135]MCA2641087.1 nucleotide exchange factor GrpE [Microcystis sp. M087S2]